MSPDAEQILHYLTAARSENRITAEHPISGSKLANMFGLRGDGELRGIIHELRVAGEPIGANGKGYFLCVTYEEARGTAQSLSARTRAMGAAANGMTQKFQTQLTL